MTALLEAVGLTKHWGGVRALDSVSFALRSGEMLALIGPNGAGKSTCFGILGGQVEADSGEVRVAGTTLGRGRLGRSGPGEAFRAGIGRTFQVARGFASLTAAESVRAARLAAVRPDDAAAIEADLAALGLRGRGAVQVAQLAHGEAKRLDLAIALASRPRVLLLDEPAAGLSAEERLGLMRLVQGLVAATGLGCLFTEHAMDAVFGFANRVLVLDRGRLVAQGTPDAVRADPAARAAYLGEPVADGAAA